MALNNIGRQICRHSATGAGDSITVIDKQLISDGYHLCIVIGEVLVVKPANATSTLIHQAGSDHGEGTGAQANNWHMGAVCSLQIINDVLTVV